MQTVITKIRMALERKGLSQEAMADLLGIQQSAYCKIENEAQGLSFDIFVKIIRILELGNEDILQLLGSNGTKIETQNNHHNTVLNGNFYASGDNNVNQLFGTIKNDLEKLEQLVSSKMNDEVS